MATSVERIEMQQASRWASRGERGQSAVEFALVLPVLIVILMGTIDFGRLYFSYVTVANAARVGAEFGMDTRRTQTELRQIIRSESSPYININDSDITLTGSPSWAPGNDLTVEVRTQFSAFTPIISRIWGGGSLTLRGVATTRFSTT